MPSLSAGAWLGQVAVIVFGWWVVHALSSKRDREKARREMLSASLEEISRTLGDLIVLARSYHLESRDVSREVRLKMTLQDLGMRLSVLNELERGAKNLARCRSDLGALRRAISGEHFEDEHTGPLVESDAVLEEIADAHLRCQRSLLTAKHAQFPS